MAGHHKPRAPISDATSAATSLDARRTAEIAIAERRERSRLADALHDDALQRVILARQDLAEAAQDPGLVQAVHGQLGEVANSLRAVTRAMHEDTLAELPLAHALDRLAEDAARRGRLMVRTSVGAQATGDHDRFVVDLARELLANVTKHASAKSAELSVAVADGAIILRVADDGRGIGDGDLAGARDAGHLGHARVERALAAIGGRLAITTPPGGGTAVTCTMPRGNLRAQRTLEESFRGPSGPARWDGVDRRAAGTTRGPAAIAKRLGGLVDRARTVTVEADVDGLLEEAARLVHEELGWAVVISRHRPARDDFVVSAGAGIDPRRWEHIAHGSYTREQWRGLLDEQFARRGAYLVPGEREDGTSRRRDDDLLVPFRYSDDRLLGVLSLDRPHTGRRPTDEELDLLVAVATHAGLVVLQAQETLVRRSRATALDRLLVAAARLPAVREPRALLELVASGIADALGFGRVLVEHSGAAGLLQLAVVHGPDPGGELAALEPLARSEVARLLASGPGAGDAAEPHRLLTREQAVAGLPAARRALLSSKIDGEAGGGRGWGGHLLLVPLRDPDGELVGLLWLDDPVDRLLPDTDVLRALCAFAAEAAAALRAVTALQRLELTVERDPATGLDGRRTFLRELEREVARTQRTGTCSVLVLAAMIDAPLLERPPGAAGAGDREALREAAEGVAAELRCHDRAFRVEDNLFAVLLIGGQTPPATTAVTLRIAARLQAIGRQEGAVVRFGTAVIRPGGGASASVFRRAAAQLLEGGRAPA